jgi:hypothetical protein
MNSIELMVPITLIPGKPGEQVKREVAEDEKGVKI